MSIGDLAKVSVVVGVGASRGTGTALAPRFARERLHTFVAGRTAEHLEGVAAEIREAGGNATPVATDTTREADVVQLLDRAPGEGASLDLVAYNAGNNRFRPLTEMDNAFWALHTQHPSAWTLALELRPSKEPF